MRAVVEPRELRAHAHLGLQRRVLQRRSGSQRSTARARGMAVMRSRLVGRRDDADAAHHSPAVAKFRAAPDDSTKTVRCARQLADSLQMTRLGVAS